MGWFGDLVGAIPVVGDVAQAGISVIGAVTGSGGDSQAYAGIPIPGQTSAEHTTYILSRLNSGERTQLETMFRAANPTRQFSLDPVWMPHAIYGGNDGRVSSSAGKALLAFWQSMERKYPLQASSSSSSWGGNNVWDGVPGAAGSGGGAFLGVPWWLWVLGGVAVWALLRKG